MDTTSRDVRPGATLRTFLIADVRGYTKFTAAHGDAVAARLAKKFADLARDAVEARGGRVIELRGDDALAVFEDTAQAVRAALDFQLTCAEETAADDELPVPVGIGIDAGEAVPVEDGFRGVALNMAARLCSNAKAGQVIVTRNVATIVGSGNGLSFEARGSVELKGFEKPQELVEAIARGVGPRDLGVISQESTMPIELDATTPLVGREHEMHWLRGTWRQARRGTGRLMFVTGGAQMGKTRLAAEIAAEVTALGGDVEYVGAGGAGPALAVGAISRVAQAATPAILVVNDVEALGDDVARVISDATSSIARVPALVLVLVRDADTLPALSTAITDANARGDGLIKLGPLDANGVAEIVRLYAGDAVVDAPLESIARSSGGVPGRVHEVASEWARDEAGRRLVAAAEFISEGRARRGAGLDFANNVINLRLGRMYGTETVTEIDECPYKGLAPFDEEDAAYFFGRERLVGELAARTVGVGLLGVIGASGSGKSSVVRAGLVPSLHADLLPGSARWRAVVMRPGDDPAGTLRDALGGITLEAAVDQADPDQRLVLIVDQFEEVFTLVEDDEARATFLDAITSVIERPDRVIVVLVMRDDFYGRCAPHEQLARALSANHVLVAPMGRDEMRRAIELPARRARLHVEAALVDALIGEAGDEPGSLPLLSTAMAELWAARSDGWMRMESYEETGGLRGAIARLAEESFARLSPPEQEAARAMLLRLTGSGEGATVTRRRASLDEFDLGRHPETQAVLDRFTQDRLLTMSEGSVEVAHEALLREWPRLREWLEEDVQGRQLRLHLTEAAKQWDASGRELGELYRGARLSSALDWTTLHGRELNELEQLFVTESRQASEHEIERQRRTNRRLRGLLSGVAVFLVLALIAGVLALVQRSTARKNATAETAQRLGAQALVQNDLDLSLLLAREGVNVTDTTATRGYLLAALLRSPAALGVLRPLPGRQLQVFVIDSGKRLLVSNNAGTAGVVDIAARKLVAQVQDVSFLVPSADGSLVVVGGPGREV
ncbi:MAG: nSTAND1 domain-containing NTPase, partial [Actinomycetota bacterium]